ncbi:chemotaxis protein CheY [Andreesenia angusta]|uniref:Chemotaxis protein CheY n=1 Tax=Andreesenia angusta TaxID=39480 RepID=A0A1S1V9L3_9FIRM|nr:response regulator [Andreesenia angusta]OHW63303.1 chemotaxis protein CheY [Andreesenia angusta]
MKIFIVEDDENIIRILEKIIMDRKLGDVVGRSTESTSIVEDIKILRPDIVLVDLLMPAKDGISLIKEAKSVYPNIHYIMISQVSSKDMIAKAYESGIEYYVSKPLNAVEIENVIKKVEEKIDMKKKLVQIQSLFSEDKKDEGFKSKNESSVEGVKRVMQRIGIIGESGSQDIINLASYLMESGESMADYTVNELCTKFSDSPRTMEQRIRRTATTGLINLANIGIEDYMNEIFTEYSSGLYSFEQLKVEMDYIRGKSDRRGKVNIKKFIDGLIYSGRTE